MVIYRADEEFDAWCPSRFQIADAHDVSHPAGVQCVMCVSPVYAPSICGCHDFCFCITYPQITLTTDRSSIGLGPLVTTISERTFLMKFDDLGFGMGSGVTCRWFANQFDIYTSDWFYRPHPDLSGYTPPDVSGYYDLLYTSGPTFGFRAITNCDSDTIRFQYVQNNALGLFSMPTTMSPDPIPDIVVRKVFGAECSTLSCR